MIELESDLRMAESELHDARRTLAQIADRVTEYILGKQSLQKANEVLVLIREQAQDALK